MGVRITICIDNEPAQLAFVENLFEQNKNAILYKSDNTGCGCCVHMWDIECTEELAKIIPENYLATSDWTEQD